MSKLTGKHIKLRALEPSDLDFLFTVENNEEFWEVSTTQTPYSRAILKQYLDNAHLDIYTAKQLRLVIQNKNNTPVGLIDLFDFNPQHSRAGVGILVLTEHQQKGYATEALELIREYAFPYLNLKQLYANINVNNTESIQLFEKSGYIHTGTRKNWMYYNGTFSDVAFYQLIHS
ncbi:GNAT family N-acetyltransferase [Wenyingzhuangia sp. IMCC45574]